MKKVLIVSSHPDDEILGAGGTLLKHVANGDDVYWLIITNIFEHQGFAEQRIADRQAEIDLVTSRVGIKETIKLNYPTMSLTSESLLDMIPKITDVFSRIKPEIIYCVNRSDAHSDHRVTFDAVLACTKSFRHPYIQAVLMYECISETEFAPALPEKAFIPNYFVDITDYLPEKLELMKIYDSELAEPPFPRSIKNIEALATFRGATINTEYAEAFQLLKYIEK